MNTTEKNKSKTPATEPASYNTLYLIDISSFIFRAFYAVRELTAPDGTPVNAVSGVAGMLGKLLDEANPKYLAVVYDSKEPSFRKEMYADYKANRSAPPDALLPQFDLIEELVRLMGIPSFRQSGVEADDLMATLRKRWIAQDEKHRVVLVTGDKDLMALVDGKTQLWDTMKDVHYTQHEVIEKFGVYPSQIRDYLAMVGDASDNIPGITGIGPKGAELLLKEFKDLDGVLAAAKAGKVKGKKGEMIVADEQAALLSRDLATLKEDIPLEVSVENARFQLKTTNDLLEFFKRFNFKQLYTKYSAKMRNDEANETLGQESLGMSGPAASDAPAFDASFDFGFSSKPASVSSSFSSSSSGKSFSAPVSSFGAVESVIPSVPYTPEFKTLTDLGELQKLVLEIKKTGLMSFDVETTSLDPKLAVLVGIAIAVNESGAHYLPINHAMSLAGPTQLNQVAVLEILRPILESSEIKKVGQNLKYDLRVMHNAGVKLGGLYADTMMAAYLLDSTGQHNLAYLSRKYLGYEASSYEEVAGKGAAQITFDQVPIDVATRYSAEDAWCALMLWQKLGPQLKTQHFEKLYQEIDLPLVEVIALMEEAGIKVDLPFLKKLEVRFEAEMKEIEKKVQSFSKNPTLNLNSPKQLGPFLFEELKLPTQGKTKTGFSTDASVLEKLSPLHEAPRLLLEYREISKLKGTYVLPLQEISSKADARIRTSFHLTGTATGRLSSSDPNLQNIPTRSKRGQLIREAFIAEEGNVLISADYSQIELRILAHLSGDDALVDSFLKDEDVHRRTASEIFKIQPEAVNDQQRGIAKAINFGLMYGKSAFALAEELDISRSDAKNMITQYFIRYAKVKEFLDDTIEFAKQHGYVATLLGRKRLLPEIRSSNHMVRGNAERMAMNSPIQGSASDLIKLAMIQLQKRLEDEKFKSRILLQVHDELVLEAPQNEVEKVSALVREVMEGAQVLKVPLRVNVGVGKNWAEL
jgi:DNA polymerase-1